MRKARFEIHDSTNRQFFFLLIAANNRVIATGETYTTKHSVYRAIYTIESIRDGAAIIPIIDKTKSAKKKK